MRRDGEGRRTGRPDALLIAGPSASGKSALALRLAARLNGAIINADAMQVYADLSILTARPSAADEARAPHHLFGCVNGADAYSVSRWLTDVRRALALVEKNGQLPIVVGGTGLYLKVLVEGLSAIPDIPADVRTRIRAMSLQQPPAQLHAQLAACDPATACRLRPSDPQRIVRALEVFEATGRSLSAFHEEREQSLLDVTRCRAVALATPRDALQTGLNTRFDAMIADGGLEEVERLARRRLDPALPVMRAIGVPPLLRHLCGDLALEAAIVLAKGQTRLYAKRQDTFARSQLRHFTAMAPEEAEGWLCRQPYS